MLNPHQHREVYETSDPKSPKSRFSDFTVYQNHVFFLFSQGGTRISIVEYFVAAAKFHCIGLREREKLEENQEQNLRRWGGDF